MNGSLTTSVVLPLLIGVVAGLRAMTAPAVVSWAARFGRLSLGSTSRAVVEHALSTVVLAR